MSLNKILTDKQQEFILNLSTQMQTQNPKSYLKHMLRNPDLEGILDVIGTLAQALEIKNEKVCLWSKTNDSSFIGCNHQSLHATQITQFSNCPFCGGKIEVV